MVALDKAEDGIEFFRWMERRLWIISPVGDHVVLCSEGTIYDEYGQVFAVPDTDAVCTQLKRKLIDEIVNAFLAIQRNSIRRLQKSRMTARNVTVLRDEEHPMPRQKQVIITMSRFWAKVPLPKVPEHHEG